MGAIVTVVEKDFGSAANGRVALDHLHDQASGRDPAGLAA
jgi:hypothetical protein